MRAETPYPRTSRSVLPPHVHGPCDRGDAPSRSTMLGSSMDGLESIAACKATIPLKLCLVGPNDEGCKKAGQSGIRLERLMIRWCEAHCVKEQLARGFKKQILKERPSSEASVALTRVGVEPFSTRSVASCRQRREEWTLHGKHWRAVESGTSSTKKRTGESQV